MNDDSWGENDPVVGQEPDKKTPSGMTKEVANMSDFMRGFETSLGPDMATAMAGTLTGGQYLTGLGMTDGKPSMTMPDYFRGVAQKSDLKRKFPELADIGGIGDFIDWGQESTGSAVGSTLPSVVAATIGGYLGKKVAGKKGMGVGSLLGATGASTTQNYADIFDSMIGKECHLNQRVSGLR